MSIPNRFKIITKNMSEIFNNGKKNQLNEFWSIFQQNGMRKDYQKAFMFYTDDIFKPIYDIVPENAEQMFMNSKITDLSHIFKNQRIVLNLTQTKEIKQFIAYSSITHLPVLDLTCSHNLESIFEEATELIQVEKIIVNKDNTFHNAFLNTKSLREIYFEGLIENNIDIHWSPLSKNSLISLLSCLSESAVNKTLTLSLSAVNRAFETTKGAKDGSLSEAWANLISNKENWTILLI